MKEEHSAGGIILKHIQKIWHILVIKDMNGNWTFPKGIIDPGEVAQTTAKREIREEVGLTQISEGIPLKQISYWYVRDGNKIHKTVSYFLFKSTGEEQPKPQVEEGITEVRWMEIHDVLKHIGYAKTNVPLLTEILTTL